MEIALVSDQHFGSEEFNGAVHDSYKKFYNEIFFPKLIKKKIKLLFDLGDTFDRRANVNEKLISWSKEVYFDRLRDLGVKVLILRGNHNPRTKLNSKNLDIISCIASEYSNISLIDKVTQIRVEGKKLCLVPYIDYKIARKYGSKVWREKFFGEAKRMQPDIFFTHLAFCDYPIYENKKSGGGFSDSLISYLNAPVISGHYHPRSVSNKFPFLYLGSPFATSWAEFDVRRGFHLFNTNSLKTSFIQNCYQAFQYVLVDSLSDIDEIELNYKSNPSCLSIILRLDRQKLLQKWVLNWINLQSANITRLG